MCAAPTACTSRARRDLRRAVAGAGAGRAGTDPCRRVAGWRVARSSATIDPVMVREPALPVVRRATADDVTAVAAQMAKTFLDDPVSSHIFRNEARREAGLRAYFGTQMKADYLPFGGCYVAEGYVGAIWAPAGKPMPTVVRGMLTMLPVMPYVIANMRTTFRLLALVESKHPREAALVPGQPRHGGGPAGQGRGRRPHATRARALRRRRHPLLPRIVQGAEPVVLPSPRLRGGRRATAARRRADAVDDVAGAATLGLRSPAPAFGQPTTPFCAGRIRWPDQVGPDQVGPDQVGGSGGVDALGHGEHVVDDHPEHVNDGARPEPTADPAAAGPRRPGGGEAR